MRAACCLAASVLAAFAPTARALPSASLPSASLPSASLPSASLPSSTAARDGSVGPDPVDIHVDWRSKGVVGGVQSQGQGGSSNLVAVAEAIASALAIAAGTGGPPPVVTVASLAKCAATACPGPFVSAACLLKFAKDTGVCPCDSSPGKPPSCTCDCQAPLKLSEVVAVTPNNETALLAAVQKGPVLIAVEADQPPFRDYRSGVMASANCGTKLDHGMLVVGFGGGGPDTADGRKPDMPYWILQNSWGPEWGEKGYIRILRGTGTDQPGECGITLAATLPLAAPDM